MDNVYNIRAYVYEFVDATQLNTLGENLAITRNSNEAFLKALWENMVDSNDRESTSDEGDSKEYTSNFQLVVSKSQKKNT